MLQDIAILAGAQVVSEEVGLKLENTTLDMLGRARKIVVTKDETTIVEGTGAEDEIKGRINQIKAGAATEVELKEKKHRIEDAVSATKAAVEEGIVPGGGVALLFAQAGLDKLDLEGDEATGGRLIRLSLEAPLKQIAVNAGLEG